MIYCCVHDSMGKFVRDFLSSDFKSAFNELALIKGYDGWTATLELDVSSCCSFSFHNGDWSYQ